MIITLRWTDGGARERVVLICPGIYVSRYLGIQVPRRKSAFGAVITGDRGCSNFAKRIP